ncbi:MAG: methylmalonyl Co-A mutase-associated GTPase MeaB [Puniceicoccales bacterium]
MPSERQRTEWTPEDAHHGAFNTEVMSGVNQPVATRSHKRKRRVLTPNEAVAGILAGDRTILARAITLIESRAEAHRETAREILRRCLPEAGKSIRVGITGTPGAGKSTFIECLGKKLCDAKHKVAVLAVDPSSSRTGGSVLGDKTRMEELTREPNAFIRPSPSSGALGGVAAKTREAMLLCEAAGFDVILIETVGVGQSEVAVRTMVDFFLLLQIAGGGDELQGIKKGVIEMADAIAVNKADGDNARRALAAKVEYSRVLHYLSPYTPDWTPQAITCSAHTGAGIDELWQMIEGFHNDLSNDGRFAQIRRDQNKHWLHSLLKEAVLQQFYARQSVAGDLPEIEKAVASGELPVVEAVERLLRGSR